jgi:hypothetical protein
VRVIALVTLLSLSVVSALGGPHLHPSPDGGRTECATCNYRLNPHQQPIALATSPTVVLRVEEAVVVFELAPRAERCLARAPKQGPPAA